MRGVLSVDSMEEVDLPPLHGEKETATHGGRRPAKPHSSWWQDCEPSTGFVKPKSLMVSLVARGSLVYLATYLGLRERTFWK